VLWVLNLHSSRHNGFPAITVAAGVLSAKLRH
jgi:hypothetical protein